MRRVSSWMTVLILETLSPYVPLPVMLLIDQWTTSRGPRDNFGGSESNLNIFIFMKIIMVVVFHTFHY